MAGKFGGFEEEEDVLAPKEPQVLSADPAERKAARALRIKRRQEALKKADQPAEEAAAEEEQTLIEQATAAAAEDLQRLALDGAAKVTNVKVTTDEREVIRRNLLSDKMEVTLEKIESEATDAQIQYEAITSNWDVMMQVRDPLDIDEAMHEQRKMCDELLTQKDQLIAELKADLKKMDEDYYEDLNKQDREIKELSERIEKQVTIMQRAYEKQLSLIEHAINIEREAMVDHNNKRWEALYRQRDKEELQHIDYKMEQLEEHKEHIEEIMWDHHEKYREAKIELETLIQELQKELEKLKATCLINTEKIGYNYQVLKKREEENVFVRSQQKRKLNKMSDVANALRLKIRRAAEDGAAEELRADDEILKLMQAMADLEKKSDHFSQVSDYKFAAVWRMCSARCRAVTSRVRGAEVSLHAQLMAEPPPPPPPPPPASPLAGVDVNQGNSPRRNEITTQKGIGEAQDRLVRHILRLVADNTGFLIEDRLFTLIEKYQSDSRNLCTLDAIFMALEIQDQVDIELLCQTFLKYAFCPICIGLDANSDFMDAVSANVDSSHDDIRQAMSVKSPTSTKGDKMSIRRRSSVARTISASTSRSIHFGVRLQDMSASDQQLMTEADEILQKYGGPALGVESAGPSPDASLTARRGAGRVTLTDQRPDAIAQHNPYLCQVGHPLEIEPMQVLTALGEFISIFVPPDKKKYYGIMDSLKPPNFSSPSRELKREDIENYWAQWKAMFPSEKDRFWDGLLTGLNNYLNILQERERIHTEVVALRRRNAGLRRLVRGTLPEVTTAPPKYARPAPAAFTAPYPDPAPAAHDQLPPI